MQEQTETFSVLVENRFGVLTRVAGLFSARGYNIDSLSVSPTENPEYSRMTIVTHGDADILEQIEKQLVKLIEVVRVVRLSKKNFLVSELMLICVHVKSAFEKAGLLSLAREYDAVVEQESENSVTLRVVGCTENLNELVSRLPAANILELARTGSVAIVNSVLNS